MTLPPAFHESLPYIDPEPSPEALAAARALIAAETSSSSSSSSSSSTTTTTTALPAAGEPSFTPLLETELARVASKTPLPPLDLARYEAPSSSSSTSSDPAALRQLAVSSSYLASRLTHLRLLDAYGRHAWLLGNHALEAELARLERALAAARRDVDVVNLERRRRQDAARGEMASLEDGWKRGVGRVLETEVAVEELRARIREEMRRRATGGGPSEQQEEAQ